MSAFFVALIVGMSSLADNQQKESAAALIERTFAEFGAKAATEKLRDLELDTEGRYLLNEKELDDLGKRLLQEREVSIAFKVFELNAKKFPGSWKVHESLGEGYYFMGMRVGQALASYGKALELKEENLDNARAFERLDSMQQGGRAETAETIRYEPGETVGSKGPYLGQAPPGAEPKVFAPGIVSTSGHFEYSVTVSPDSREILFNRGSDIMVTRLVDDGWSAPVEAGIDGAEAQFSRDGESLFYVGGDDGPEVMQVEWPVESGTEGKHLFPGLYATPAKSGAIYFMQIEWGVDNGILVRSSMKDGVYSDPEPLVGAANSPYADSHPVISPDESFIIFDSTRPDGLGWADLYVSFRKNDETWGEGIHMGSPLSNETNNICASLSPDGKYLFFTSNNDIYWVSIEAIARFKSGGLSKSD
jgi:hypothetical protein